MHAPERHLYQDHKISTFHNVACTVHVYQVFYKFIQHYALITVQKHIVRLLSDIFTPVCTWEV